MSLTSVRSYSHLFFYDLGKQLGGKIWIYVAWFAFQLWSLNFTFVLLHWWGPISNGTAVHNNTHTDLYIFTIHRSIYFLNLLNDKLWLLYSRIQLTFMTQLFLWIWGMVLTRGPLVSRGGYHAWLCPLKMDPKLGFWVDSKSHPKWGFWQIFPTL